MSSIGNELLPVALPNSSVYRTPSLARAVAHARLPNTLWSQGGRYTEVLLYTKIHEGRLLLIKVVLFDILYPTLSIKLFSCFYKAEFMNILGKSL